MLWQWNGEDQERRHASVSMGGDGRLKSALRGGHRGAQGGITAEPRRGHHREGAREGVTRWHHGRALPGDVTGR